MRWGKIRPLDIQIDQKCQEVARKKARRTTLPPCTGTIKSWLFCVIP